MKLTYCEVNNFGDKLNPIIFNYLLSDVLDNNDEELFVGIGSILGFEKLRNNKKKIVFTTGYAYHNPPHLDDTWDIICVRGPLTAKALQISEKKYAIIDGAALLKLFNIDEYSIKYKYSYMPHWKSDKMYNWKEVCKNLDIHYISPSGNVWDIIKEIKQSEVIFSEAMHGAIVADVLRIPWVPVKAYDDIHEFKWRDWTISIDQEYKPVRLNKIFYDNEIKNKIERRLEKYHINHSTLSSKIVKYYKVYQDRYIIDKMYDKMSHMKYNQYFLSDEKVLDRKVDQLVDLLETIKKKYS